MTEFSLDTLKQCDACQGCIQCGADHCIYNVNGNREICYFEICKYCSDYLQKPKLFLNNVG